MTSYFFGPPTIYSDLVTNYAVTTGVGCAPFESSGAADLTFTATDESGREVRLTFTPEADITPLELSKLLMFSLAHIKSPCAVNALAFVKKHHLERHFTYA